MQFENWIPELHNDQRRSTPGGVNIFGFENGKYLG